MSAPAHQPILHRTCSFSLDNQLGALVPVLSLFKDLGADLSHIESRKSVQHGYDFITILSIPEANFDRFASDVSALVKCFQWLDQPSAIPINQKHGFPTRIADLDFISQETLEYGAELASDHPGFSDTAYRARRRDIVAIGKQYRHGQPLPRIEYTAEETNTWRVIYHQLSSLYTLYACHEHQRAFSRLEQCGLFSPDAIPQLHDVSAFLQQATGFSLRPVAGLLSARDFLNGLAFRVFFSTQYIRHASQPFYTPEPDVCHELLGHAPLFADPDFAELSQQVGLASLGASDEDLQRLVTLYWYTVEFGVCKQHSDGRVALKAYGAGLLSSFGELEYAMTSNKPKMLPFDPKTASELVYPITQFQPAYFVADSFQTAKEQISAFAKTLSRPFEVIYQPLTRSVLVLDKPERIAQALNAAKSQIETLSSALSLLGHGKERKNEGDH